MAFDPSIIFRIKADGSQAEKEFQKFRKEFQDTDKAIKNSGGVLERFALGFAQGLGVSAKETAAFKANVLDLAKGIGILGAGLTAGVAAVGGFTVAMFQLAKSTADYGSEIFDATQKTGQSAETMSALKFAAEQSGSSFEAVTNAVSKFNVLLGQAATQNEKATGVLQQYGITATDTTQALQQAVTAIASMTDPSQQAAAATALFKDRTGEILPVIKSFSGDLPGLIDRLQKLGLIMSGEDVEAADEFGDQMDLLSKQLTGVKLKIGAELMPVFLDFAKAFSDFLQNNPGAVKSWGQSVASIFHRALLAIEEFHASVELLKADWEIFTKTPTSLTQQDFDKFFEARRRYDAEKERIRLEIQGGVGSGRRGGVNDQFNELAGGGVVPLDATIDPAEVKRRQDAVKQAVEEGLKALEKAAQEAERRQQERLASLNKYYQEVLRSSQEAAKTTSEIWEKEFETGAITAEEYLKRSSRLATTVFDQVKEQLDNIHTIEQQQAKNNIDLQTADLQHTQAVIAAKRESQLALDKVTETISKKLAENEEDQIKREEEQLKVLESLIDSWEEYGKVVQSVLDRVNDQMEKWAGLNREVDDLIRDNISAARDLEDAQAGSQRRTLENILRTGSGADRKKARAELDRLDDERAQRQLNRIKQDLAFEEKAALERIKGKENEEYQKLLIEEEYRKRREEADIEFESRKEERERQRAIRNARADNPLGVGFFDQLDDASGNIRNFGDVLSQLGDVAGGVFLQMGQGLGNMLQQWVLLGDQADISMKKMVASVLAGVAAQAATLAIFHLAMGIAALTPWGAIVYGPAPLHFKAAALWGTIAVGAAIAGRAVAGDSFKKETAKAGVSSASAGRSSNTGNQGEVYSSQKNGILGESRNTPLGGSDDSPRSFWAAARREFMEGLKAEVKISLNDRGVIDVIEDNVKNNGRMRVIIQRA